MVIFLYKQIFLFMYSERIRVGAFGTQKRKKNNTQICKQIFKPIRADYIFQQKKKYLLVLMLQNQNLENANLFTVIEKGDRKIKTAYKKAIILVGLTRIGKSTTYNWILRRPMTGRGGRINSHYINGSDDDQSAKVGNSFTSVTLAPNVHIEFEEGLSLIDMAGYEDTRNFIGVIGVSYFLKTLFQQVREVKFIIVFDENKFTQENGSGLARTFNGFINMFHYKEMPKEIKDKLKSSISVVITKSRNPEAHLQYLDQIVTQFSDKSFNLQNKEQVIDLIKYVRDSARVHPFLVAKENTNPEECQFIKTFSEKKKWNFFDLDQAQKVMQKSPISLPFEKDFHKLKEQEKNAFSKALEDKVQSYLGFSQILEMVIGNFSNNWTQFLEVWRNQGKSIPNHFMMNPTFDKIREYVQVNDVYNSKQTLETKFRVNYEPLTLIKSINQMLAIYDHVFSIGTAENFQGFIEAMGMFDQQFSALIQCLRGFASNNEDEELLQRLKYILTRGFREFIKLYQLNPSCIHDAKQRLKDNCNIAFDIKKEKLIQLFVSQFTSDLLVKLFPTLQLLLEYEQFFKMYEQDYRNYKSLAFFSQRRGYIQIAKADLLLASGQKVNALKCYIKALKSLSDICVGVATQENEDQCSDAKESKLNALSMNKIKMIRRIVNILRILPESENINPKNYALQLCKHHKMIEDTCQIYQSLIDSSSTNTVQKLRNYAEYAEYCAKWGRIQRGIQQLQKKLVLQEQNFEDYSNTFHAMNKMMIQREEYIRNFITATKETKKLPLEDAELNQLLQEIDSRVI